LATDNRTPTNPTRTILLTPSSHKPAGLLTENLRAARLSTSNDNFSRSNHRFPSTFRWKNGSEQPNLIKNGRNQKRKKPYQETRKSNQETKEWAVKHSLFRTGGGRGEVGSLGVVSGGLPDGRFRA
jgi:hypothetical protein